MARRSISGAHHPLRITLVMPTGKGTGELDGLFGQIADFLGYVHAEAMIYVLREEDYDINLDEM